MTEAQSAQFDARLRQICPAATVRPEVASDVDFLCALFVACSPLRELLPAPIVEQQAQFQYDSQQLTAPLAMRRIVTFEGEPAARIAVDWSLPGVSHGVDIAVLPRFRKTMIGPAMLRAWIAAADSFAMRCTLEVLAGNRALHLYRRFGFSETPGIDPAGPILSMERPAIGSA